MIKIVYGLFDKTFQHTAARRRLGDRARPVVRFKPVSTHSRPKAAGAGIG